MKYVLDEMKYKDWEQVAQIYAEGIKTGIATFQSEVPTFNEWDASHLKCCRIAARLEEKVLGWAALSPVSSRCVYSGVAEVSLYVKQGYRGIGIGEALLKKLIELSENNGVWTLQSGIMRENIKSIFLHGKCGFREIGYREKLGRMPDGTWHDTVLMERRSKTVGVK